MLWKAVVGLVVFVMAALGGTGLYIRHQITTTLDDAARRLSPVAEVRYAGVSVTPGGTVRIRKVDIQPRMFDDPVRIEGIEVETPGLWFLLTGSKQLREGRLPEHLRATVRGLALNLGGPVAEMVDRTMAGGVSSSGVAPASNCGDVRTFDFNAYQRLGYTALVFDISLGYRFEKQDGPFRLTIEARARDVALTTVSVEFSAVSPNVRDNIGRRAPLRGFDVVYQDLSFTDRVTRYCAKASGTTVEQYVDAEVTRSLAVSAARWGLVGGPGLRQAYRDFLIKPGELRVQGRPSPEVDLLALRRLKPEDIIARLNLRVSVNGKPVTDLSMAAAASSVTGAPPPSPSTVAAVASVTPRLPAPPPSVVTSAAPLAPTPASATSEFRPVPTTDLDQHVGKTVRIHLTHGVIHEGRLLNTADGVARIERRLQGGAITLTIPVGAIERVEVLL